MLRVRAPGAGRAEQQALELAATAQAELAETKRALEEQQQQSAQMAQVKAELEQFNDQMCDQVEMLMAQREELGQRLQQAEARAAAAEQQLQALAQQPQPERAQPAAADPSAVLSAEAGAFAEQSGWQAAGQAERLPGAGDALAGPPRSDVGLAGMPERARGSLSGGSDGAALAVGGAPEASQSVRAWAESGGLGLSPSTPVRRHPACCACKHPGSS